MEMNKHWVIEAAKMVQERVEAGFEPSMLTLMFKDMKGSESSRMRVMARVAEDIYTDLLHRFVKHTKNKPINELPLFLGCVDWPVPKAVVKTIQGISNNDGMHFAGLYLVPPKCRTTLNLADVVDRHRGVLMRSGLLTNIHVESVLKTPGEATRYVLKSAERLRISHEDILLLPKTHSEMEKRRPKAPLLNSRPNRLF